MPSIHPLPESAVPANPPDLSSKLPKLGAPRRTSAGQPSQRQQENAAPAPVTPMLPAPIFSSNPSSRDFSRGGAHKWLHPRKRILSERSHQLFLNSPTHELVVAFVFMLSDSVRDCKVRDVRGNCAKVHGNEMIEKLENILDEAEELVKANPPDEAGGSRFGNPGFRRFLDGVEGKLKQWHQVLGVSAGEDGTQEQQEASNHSAIECDAWEECAEYLRHSFGNRERIDYGSGHELNFILWLLCLRQVDVIPAKDPASNQNDRELFAALALLVFPRYLRLMRTIQTTYYLEPAGSHGVWGLDDYQFLPFLFGASQLCAPLNTASSNPAKKSHPLTPKSIHNPEYVIDFAPDYLYFDQVSWVNSTKIGVEGLRWHSPMLDDISAAKSWEKIEGGMRKMFLAEVLGKLPVAQHLLFGSILPAVEGMGDDGQGDEVEMARHGHVHDGKGWNDCCGIQVPSMVQHITLAIFVRQHASAILPRSHSKAPVVLYGFLILLVIPTFHTKSSFTIVQSFSVEKPTTIRGEDTNEALRVPHDIPRKPQSLDARQAPAVSEDKFNNYIKRGKTFLAWLCSPDSAPQAITEEPWQTENIDLADQDIKQDSLGSKVHTIDGKLETGKRRKWKHSGLGGEINGKKYPPASAHYDNSFWRRSGIIFAADNRSPKFMAVELQQEGKWNPIQDAIPQVNKWSDVAFVSWKSVCGAYPPPGQPSLSEDAKHRVAECVKG
ncbi:PTPA-domain-containing protein [Polychaeton citri CBS 116435]|uniref:Serine/threonine-protein phosphatase 2A activator n=1 Tax=Polychaeton citri CBS 116435 TaxID=1314669 RepID=A0A9P4Q7E7_9PEZI|nr:PTPA-domain-containing protein [Polychaeton citri CBS 116435]